MQYWGLQLRKDIQEAIEKNVRPPPDGIRRATERQLEQDRAHRPDEFYLSKPRVRSSRLSLRYVARNLETLTPGSPDVWMYSSGTPCKRWM